MRLLLRSGAAIDSTDKNMWTPLICAAYSGASYVLSLHLSLFIYVYKYPTLSLLSIKIYIQLSFSAPLFSLTHSNTILSIYLSPFTGSLNVMLVLVAKGAHTSHLTNNGNSALHYLVRHADLDFHLLRKLLPHLLSIGGRDRTEYFTTLRNNYAETPLHSATLRGSSWGVAYILKNGCDSNVKTDRGFTPIHLAAKSGNIEVIRALLEAGANPTLDSAEGTPIAIAEGNGNPEIAEYLRNWIIDKESDEMIDGEHSDSGEKRLTFENFLIPAFWLGILRRHRAEDVTDHHSRFIENEMDLEGFC